MIALLCAAICSGACGRKEESPPPERVSAARKAPRPISPRWVTTYDPVLAWNGYTLTLHDLRIPVLLDMNGRPVHAWPRARIKSRVRLLPDGSILGIGLGRSVVEYDWEGRKTWEFRTENAFPHHDVIRLRNGNTLVLVLRAKEGADTLLEVDRKGKIVWTWKATEHLGGLAPPPGAHKNDATHVNSIQELPENPWFAAGDNRFRPGNILASARNLNAVFLVDRATGAIVWSYRKDLDRQHEAEMNGPDLAAPGMIQIFDNRQRSFLAERRSEIVEIDPRDGSIDWRYKAPGFFTPTGGLQQALPNGNLLITSTRGGRVFEITRAGALAWEWVPPYEPVRAVRVARD
ncbi:MAG TPA: aryl-sulfate sulfotransferase, partial [Thermoanaerobaculia bacterium]|nr:aryl-sulfate sulfotransferase [Thermoanaerobaculia bacterium]